MKRGPLCTALFLATLAFSAIAAADDPSRPYDAPYIDGEHSGIPPLPVGYITQEEAGIRFSYHPSTGERVRMLFRRAESIRTELSAELGRSVLANVEVRVAALPSEMRQVAPTELVPGYAPVLAFSQAHLVVMSAASPISAEPPDLEMWLRHGLAHLALDEAAENKPIPRWFHEGFAVQQAGQDTAVRAHALCLASLRHQLIPLGAIEGQFPADAPQFSIAYAEAADFARFLTRDNNREKFPSLIAHLREGEPLETSLPAAYGADLGHIEMVWRKEMARRYSFVPVFIIALAIWAFIAGVLLARRLSRRKALRAEQQKRDEAARRAAASAARQEARARRASLAINEDAISETLPPDPEVPKVEHDGRWHTLH